MAYYISTPFTAVDSDTGAILPLVNQVSQDQVGNEVDSSQVASITGYTNEQVSAQEKATPPGWSGTLTSSSDSSTLSDLTKGVVGVFGVAGGVAQTALQNETLASILKSRGFPVPAAPRPAASSPGWVTPVLLLLGALGLGYAVTR